ncbi:MAG: hypothetical protein DME88_04820 [Verrucomicrobia bacterium]|nr:MAG: hypothetical protein DME88_04820 [Verrucomicrobiota bacterium]
MPPLPSLRQAEEALNRRSDPRCLICDLESPRRPASLSLEQQFCREIFREHLVTGLKGEFRGRHAVAGGGDAGAGIIRLRAGTAGQADPGYNRSPAFAKLRRGRLITDH